MRERVYIHWLLDMIGFLMDYQGIVLGLLYYTICVYKTYIGRLGTRLRVADTIHNMMYIITSEIHRCTPEVR